MPRAVATALLALLAVLTVTPAALGEPPQPRIVGGTQAPAGSYPWQVALIRSNQSSNAAGQFCGGTLIAPNRVLTAAHCTKSPTTGAPVTPAQIDVLANTTSLASGGQRIDVAEYLDHPSAADPGDGSFQFDASVLRLAQSVTVPRPIGLVTATQDELWNPGTDLRITGWGAVAEDGRGPNDLREATVPRRTDASCGSTYPTSFRIADMFCAAPAGGKVDTCQGDSGGPIAAGAVTTPSRFAPGDWRLAGATSWGNGCARADGPGVYTRLGAASLRDFVLPAVTNGEPYSTEPPRVTGTPDVGSTLSCSDGNWGGGPTGFQYRFERVGTQSATTIATGSSTYTVTEADRESRIACTVNASNSIGAAEMSAASLGPVPSTQVPAPTPTPAEPSAPTSPPAPDPAPAPAPAPVATPSATATPSLRDVGSPRIASVRRTCKRTRCTLAIRTTDAAPSAGLFRISVRLKARVRGVTRSRTLSSRRRSSTRFTVTVPRLGRGTYRLTLRAVDRAGNRQRVATIRAYRLSR